MSESLDGFSVSATRQNAGRPVTGCLAPGGVNEPAGTACTDVTVVFGSLSEPARRSHAAVVTAGACAYRTPPTSTVTADAAKVLIIMAAPSDADYRSFCSSDANL